MNKLPVSVTMISGAEAGRIGPALESVSGWASEIILVLNEEVRDGTEEIAAKYGAKVFREPWKGFIAQKNSASAKSTQPWLLNLDADERVSSALASEIAEVVSAAHPREAWYEFPRCSFYCGKWIRHGDWYPDRVKRLWRRESGSWVGKDPHAALSVNGPLGRLRGELLHLPMESINHQIAKTVKYADDFVLECEQKGKSVSSLDLLVRPVWRFLRAYFFKLGFLDGWQGFAIAWLTSFYTFLRYVKVFEARLPKESPR